ncbi:DEAD/DEAH box helicase [Nocardia bovistercoris]|uniref:DEAD/DEAH box helicase n=1 Tax=Nocardia bovistercoris TaxID=2785916 RepID=UPI0038CD3D1A
MTFADLGLPVALTQALRRDGIEAPFPIQAATVPDALAGKDVLGRGPTGSGKTLAFGLPMLAGLVGAAARPGRPRGLVLVPTRELAAQIERALDEPALALGLRIASVVGGAPIKRQADRLARGVDLLIATPGRLEDLIAQGSANLSEVRITALDEADHMADMGFLPQVVKLLDRTPKDGQRLLFSATLDGEVDKLVKRYLRSPVTHSTAPPSASVATMSHHLLFVSDKLVKRAVVAEIAARDGLTIMFVRTKHGADRLAKQLRGVGIAAGALHGGKAQNNRTRTLAAFAERATPVLVTTDVAARGIHVDGISLVVHVDPPAESKAYLHRAGRTARAGEDGVVVTLVTGEERADVEKMTRKAGVDVVGIEVGPGDRRLNEITGARRPPGPSAKVETGGAADARAAGEPRSGARRATGDAGEGPSRGGRRRRPASGAGEASGRHDRPSRRGADGSARSSGTSTRSSTTSSRRPAASARSSPASAQSSTAPTRSSAQSSGTASRAGTRDHASDRAQSRTTRPRSAAATPSVRTDGSAAPTGRAPQTGARGKGSPVSGRPTRADTPGQSRRRAGRPQGSPNTGNRRAN